MTKIELLEKIIEIIKPLNPPVDAFENSAKRTPFKTLISVLLSSRTKDETTHGASDRLFEAAGTPVKMKLLDEERIAELIYPVGFYRQKAKHIKKIADILSAREGESIPGTFDELVLLPGVGRKTANLVLSIAFAQPSIAVDVHVYRISRRLGWVNDETSEDTEAQLKNMFPPEYWTRINQALVGFGQTLCKPRGPLCEKCAITANCDYFHLVRKHDAQLKRVFETQKKKK